MLSPSTEPQGGYDHFIGQLLLINVGRFYVPNFQKRCGYETDAWDWAEARAAKIKTLVKEVQVFGIDHGGRAWQLRRPEASAWERDAASKKKAIEALTG
jgi:hypothetical protein